MSLLRRRVLLGNNSSVVISGSVLYSDGTFIVNEKTKDRPNNITLHGSVVEEAPLITDSNNNPWNSLSKSNRSTVSKIEFGSRVSLTNYKFSINKSYYTSVTFDATNIDTSNVTNMTNMFYNCNALTSITGLSSFDTSNATAMTQMFYGCNALTSLNLSSFNTNNVTTMYRMFYNCYALTSLDLSSFNTSNVTNMGSMFQNCNALTSLNLSSFNINNGITSMYRMFYGCYALTSLDLSSFNTSSVTSMGGMFYSCRALITIYVSLDFVVSQVTSSGTMFSNCPQLVGGSGTVYNSNYIDKTYARIDNPPDYPGYFTLKSA